MRVLFAPDWRDGVGYQTLLSEALTAAGVEVTFLSGYKRGLPLTRLCRSQNFDILHLHWPEAYFPRKGDWWDRYRVLRFRQDLAFAKRNHRLVVTAHNLHAHNRGDEWLARSNYNAAFRQADAVIAHSAAARTVLLEDRRLAGSRVHVIPHGDLSVTLGPKVEKAQARAQLRLNSTPVCLMFGAVEPYKGLEEVISFWRKERPSPALVIAGKPISEEYGDTIRSASQGEPNIDLYLQRLSDTQLHLWLAASDCVLFNYQTIFTSGAASLARSLGKPILLGSRSTTIDLDEPARSVFRFAALDRDFLQKLESALLLGDDMAGAEQWREMTGWTNIAEQTTAVYRSLIGSRSEEHARTAPLATF